MMAPMGPPFLTSSSVRARSLVMKAISVPENRALNISETTVIMSQVVSNSIYWDLCGKMLLMLYINARAE